MSGNTCSVLSSELTIPAAFAKTLAANPNESRLTADQSVFFFKLINSGFWMGIVCKKCARSRNRKVTRFCRPVTALKHSEYPQLTRTESTFCSPTSSCRDCEGWIWPIASRRNAHPSLSSIRLVTRNWGFRTRSSNIRRVLADPSAFNSLYSDPRALRHTASNQASKKQKQRRADL